MKTSSKAFVAGAGMLLLLGSLSVKCQAQAWSYPAGTCDCVMSGARQGLAYITFSNDFSFIGFEIVVPKALKIESTDSRGAGSRGDDASSTNSTTTVTNVFGSQAIAGPWGFDSKGRVIGFFTEETGIICETNFVIGTNMLGDIITNIVVECSAKTNSISFTGKVTPGKRISLVCSTPYGKITYTGVPATPLTNLSGDWYGLTTIAKQEYTEFFSVYPSAVPFPNIYYVEGYGAGYGYGTAYWATCILSKQKKIAFSLPFDDGVTLRATYGSFDLKKSRSKTKGWEEGAEASAAGSEKGKMTFEVVKQQPLAP